MSEIFVSLVTKVVMIACFRFYICCDRCQDWFHGRCVGILQSEADNIDEYVCPNCQRNSSINFANMKNLNSKDFEALKKLIKQLQVILFENRNFCITKTIVL